MNKTTKAIVLTIAVIFIVAGIGAGIFAVIMGSKDSSGDDVAGPVTTVTLHDDVEYVYDENGELKSELFYKDNVYIGKTDYYTGEKTRYATSFDADGNETASTSTEFNGAGSVVLITSYENHKLIETVEYDYHYDMRTPAKKTVKTYSGEDEYAEKTYYSEDGKKTRICKYLNGELTEETLYDENGKTIVNGGDTVEK